MTRASAPVVIPRSTGRSSDRGRRRSVSAWHDEGWACGGARPSVSSSAKQHEWAGRRARRREAHGGNARSAPGDEARPSGVRRTRSVRNTLRSAVWRAVSSARRRRRFSSAADLGDATGFAARRLAGGRPPMAAQSLHVPARHPGAGVPERRGTRLPALGPLPTTDAWPPLDDADAWRKRIAWQDENLLRHRRLRVDRRRDHRGAGR